MQKEVDRLEQAKTESEHQKQGEDIFAVEEIKIEEMAIDGICGVY